MGVTKVKLTVKNPFKQTKEISGDFLVDTGAHYTVLPKEMVEKLGIKKSFDQEFVLADGKIIKRSVGSALIKFEEKEGAIMVVLGKKAIIPF